MFLFDPFAGSDAHMLYFVSIHLTLFPFSAQPSIILKNKEKDRKLGVGISMTPSEVGIKVSFTGAATQEVKLPASLQSFGEKMKLTIVCHSATNFGIYVNGEWQTNFTEISQDFEPYTYSIILPESKEVVEFLNVEHRYITDDRKIISNSHSNCA